jgi:hypothetical protein
MKGINQGCAGVLLGSMLIWAMLAGVFLWVFTR